MYFLDVPQKGDSGAVGPPTPPKGSQGGEEDEQYYFDDEDVDDGADEHNFRRSGMYAEL